MESISKQYGFISQTSCNITHITEEKNLNIDKRFFCRHQQHYVSVNKFTVNIH